MTCPCRGDLCNGPNMEREEEAFAILNKLVSKTQTSRIKKSTEVKTSKFLTSNDQNTIIITNISTIENDELNVPSNVTSDDITQIMLGDQPALEETDENLSSTEVASTGDEVQEETTKRIDMIPRRDIISPSDDIRKGLEVLKTDKLSKPVKPSEELPTAEALQQNASPRAVSDKTTTTMTTSAETVMDTTIDTITEIPTPKAELKNNSITYKNQVLSFNIIAFSILIVLSYLI